MKILQELIHSNIYISIAAVLLTVESQIQLGMKPQFHPYLFIIFFATLFEYNIHRLIIIFTNKEALDSEKHLWLRENLHKFYLLITISVICFIISLLLADIKVLIILAPIVIFTLFYSVPFSIKKSKIIRLRDIPYAKIFQIAFVWSTTTILIPMIQSKSNFDTTHIFLMILERFLFVFSITIPFDIRDLDEDNRAGLKTIPSILNEEKSLIISYISMILFLIISVYHYSKVNDMLILTAFVISAISTLYFLYSEKIRNLNNYHYVVLDGTMILQGLLVLIFYYIDLKII